MANNAPVVVVVHVVPAVRPFSSNSTAKKKMFIVVQLIFKPFSRFARTTVLT